MQVLGVDYAGEPDFIALSLVRYKGDKMELVESEVYEDENKMIGFIRERLPVSIMMDKVTFNNFSKETQVWLKENRLFAFS